MDRAWNISNQTGPHFMGTEYFVNPWRLFLNNLFHGLGIIFKCPKG